MKKTLAFVRSLPLFAYCAAYSFVARADYDIGSADGDQFDKFTEFVQEMINFIDGPVALAFSFLSIVGLAILWAFSPRTPIMGTVFRVVVAIVVVLNVGVWIAALDS